MSANRGYTLSELLTVLTVVSLLLGTALPGLGSVIRDNRRATLLNEFLSTLYLARTEAIVEVREVTVCKSRDGSSCGDGGVAWDEGWIVFVNDDGDDPATVDLGERVLAVHAAVRAPQHVSANRDYFSFRPFPYRSVNGTISFCDDRGPAHAAAVIVSVTGRPRLSHTSADGAPLDCS
jgi:type IV fimbrial biogenesis protein FimT